MCNLLYNTPRKIPVVFDNGSSYGYHFIIKRLAEEFEGDFECLGENKEKYITFSVPIKKESNEDGTIIYRIKFIDSFIYIKYPKKLHNKHSNLPFLQERMKVNKCKKLVYNLYDKKDYVDHVRSLKQALNHGLEIKKINRVLKFNQSAWLKSYIDMNTEKRKNAKNDFDKDIYKLMNNAVYGKITENVIWILIVS